MCGLQAGLTAAVGVSSGLGSPVFAACFVLLLIIAYDATSVRREAGKHAGAKIYFVVSHIKPQHTSSAQLNKNQCMGNAGNTFSSSFSSSALTVQRYHGHTK